MTPKPLEDIGFRLSDHKSALWWLGLLYRRPRQFQDACSNWSRLKAFVLLFNLYIHFLPYLLLVIVIGRFFLFWGLGLEAKVPFANNWETWLIWHGREIAGGIAFGITSGIAVGIAGGIGGGIAVGIAFGIAGGIAFGIAGGIAGGIAVGIAGGIAGGIAVGIATGIAFGIATGITVTRCYYWPIHVFFIWPKLRPKRYFMHPVAWDNLCGALFPGLDKLLTAYIELEHQTGEQEITRLIDGYPAQKWTGLRAKARWLARQAGQEKKLALLAERVAGLPEGDEKFLNRTKDIKNKVAEIVHLQQRLDSQNRPFLRGPEAELLVAKIQNFQNEVAGYPEPLSSEFRQAAKQWLTIAEAQYQQIRHVLDKEPSPQVFRAGDPVQRNQEAFVPRQSALGELDRQLTLATGCPGVILYARRRMGKSTLLMNLEGFLPTAIRVAVISLQNPEAFTTQTALLNHVLQQIAKVCPDALPANSPVSCLPEFFQALTTCNHWLETNRQQVLLAIDEYENIDRKIGEGVFQEDLLHTLRESIQYHRHIIWLFAGSHAIEELVHAPWSSYLISARTVEIPPFCLEETRLLLTEPLKYSRLWPQDDPKRPHFDASFWGQNGIEKIQAEAGGWPHLVQLLAETAVDMSNDREQSQLDSALLEQAMQKAVTSGDTVLRQLLRGEANEAEWAYLSGFRRNNTQPPPENDEVYSALKRRLLVAEADSGEWRLRVPLMQRWLRERG